MGGSLPRVRRQARRHGGDGRLHLPGRGARRAPRREHLDGRRRRRRSSAPPGHLHPGGLWTDLTLTRDGQHRRGCSARRRSTTSPPARSSWDVSMTATPPDWRVQVRRGDVLSVTGTYDTRARLLVRVDGDHAGDVPRRRDDRRRTRSPTRSTCRARSPTATCPRTTTTAAGRSPACPTSATCSARPLADGTGTIPIQGFVFGQGDLSSTGSRGAAAARAPRRAA